MDELGVAAVAMLRALVGKTGVVEDSGIIAAQLARAEAILGNPPLPYGSLFEREPSSHAAALLALAPEDA